MALVAGCIDVEQHTMPWRMNIKRNALYSIVMLDMLGRLGEGKKHVKSIDTGIGYGKRCGPVHVCTVQKLCDQSLIVLFVDE
jgi:hypothetical protein